MNAEQKPYAGNPHVRFDERPLARASGAAGCGVYSTGEITLQFGYAWLVIEKVYRQAVLTEPRR